jgi:hypothetical protein
MNKYKLQVLLNNNWEYVFCHNDLTGIVTTKIRSKAIDHHGLNYFRNKYGNYHFRIADKDGYDCTNRIEKKKR